MISEAGRLSTAKTSSTRRLAARLFLRFARPGGGPAGRTGVQRVRESGRSDAGSLQGAARRGSPHRLPPRDGPAGDPPLAARGRRGPAGRRDFTARVKERAVGAKVTQQLSPAQEVTRIVRDELEALLGGDLADVALQGKPAVIALVGLQGSGKTTSAAKLARLLKTRGPLSAGHRRGPRAPGRGRAARDPRQQIGVPVFEPGGPRTPSRSRATASARRSRPGGTPSSSTPPDASTSTKN